MNYFLHFRRPGKSYQEETLVQTAESLEKAWAEIQKECGSVIRLKAFSVDRECDNCYGYANYVVCGHCQNKVYHSHCDDTWERVCSCVKEIN
jgi:hypothetical protein